MVKVAACDDDVMFEGKFETMLLEIAKKEHISMDIEMFTDGTELVKAICADGKTYDIIFLDIEMEGMDGLTAARQIRETDDLTMLIYVSSHQSYALEAFDVQPFQFLVKPVNPDTLYRYFMKAYGKLTKNSSYFFCQFSGKMDSLRMNSIMYFKSCRRIINIYMADGSTYKFYGKMNDLEEHFKQKKVDFWRIHQSYLVNISYIARISYDKVELRNQKILYISEDRRKMIGEKYCDYIREDIVE